MSSVLKWAEELDKSKRSKPGEQVRKELFNRIQTALAEDENPVRDCVYGLFRFDAKVVEPFYDAYYWKFNEELKNAWDRSVISWANDTKTSGTALNRILPILCNKVSHTGDTKAVREELKWLALCKDIKRNERISALGKKGDRELLLKLLTLDMTGWDIGRVGVGEIYAILFSGNKDPEIVSLYQDFLTRNHLASPGKAGNEPTMENALAEATTAEKDQAPAQDTSEKGTADEEKPGQPETAAQEQETSQPAQVHTATGNPQSPDRPNPASAEAQNREKEKVQTPGYRAKTQGVNPMDGEALAENLLKWVRGNKGQVMKQQTELLDLNRKINNLTEERDRLIEEKANLIKSEEAWQNQVFALKKEKAALEAKLQEADFAAATLQEEKDDIAGKLRQVQVMNDNSIKQEVGGLRTSLAEDLKHTIQDFRSDISDMSQADQIEVYKSLLEEMIDTLKHHRIAVEDN